MALKFSTGLRNAILDTNDLKSLLDDGYINVYSGTVPADADAALGGATLLNTYSDDDQGSPNGLDFDASASGGALGKAPAQVWSGTAVASGTASFFRFVKSGDTGNLSTTEYRIQGVVGGAGADLFVQSTTFTSSVLYTLDYFSISIPVPA